MTRIKTIERIELGICGAIDYLQSGGHKNEAIAGLLDAQKLLSKLDADAFWEGYENGEAAGRSQMKADYEGACEKSYRIGYEQATSRWDDDERLDRAMTEAQANIGTFFEGLRDIYSPKEGSGPTHG